MPGPRDDQMPRVRERRRGVVPPARRRDGVEFPRQDEDRRVRAHRFAIAVGKRAARPDSARLEHLLGHEFADEALFGGVRGLVERQEGNVLGAQHRQEHADRQLGSGDRVGEDHQGSEVAVEGALHHQGNERRALRAVEHRPQDPGHQLAVDGNLLPVPGARVADPVLPGRILVEARQQRLDGVPEPGEARVTGGVLRAGGGEQVQRAFSVLGKVERDPHVHRRHPVEDDAADAVRMPAEEHGGGAGAVGAAPEVDGSVSQGDPHLLQIVHRDRRGVVLGVRVQRVQAFPPVGLRQFLGHAVEVAGPLFEEIAGERVGLAGAALVHEHGVAVAEEIRGQTAQERREFGGRLPRPAGQVEHGIRLGVLFGGREDQDVEADLPPFGIGPVLQHLESPAERAFRPLTRRAVRNDARRLRRFLVRVPGAPAVAEQQQGSGHPDPGQHPPAAR